VKALDFGLAKLTEYSENDAGAPTIDANPHTEEGAVLGTFVYMSPEQAEGNGALPYFTLSKAVVSRLIS
jgi:hypothetical protein